MNTTYNPWVRYIIKHWPRILAGPFMRWADNQPHDPNQSCWPCASRARRVTDQHNYTTGPYTNYCSKCGLDYEKWPRYCANKTVKVNNKPQTRRPLFWLS